MGTWKSVVGAEPTRAGTEIAWYSEGDVTVNCLGAITI